MLLRCALIDDDPLFIKIFESYFRSIDFMELTQVCSDAGHAPVALDLNKVDLLFLDVEMPGMNGLDFLNSLAAAPPVIIVSRDKKYASEAFEFEAIDFLCKPVSFARFLKATNKARAFFGRTGKAEKNSIDSLYIRQNRVLVRIPIGEINYVKADDNDVIIMVADRVYKTHTKLANILDQLPHEDFMQVHRSYIVHLPKIEKVNGEIIEINARTIPVSKTHVKELHERLNIV